jgi:PhzF family phenazine biosynthesis protein
MKSYAYRILNVFAREGRLTGNPLCVFEDGRGIDDEAQQALARQFNLSETTFIFPSETANAHVRIYTPAFEMPFAGHPTLGTAHVVRSLQSCGDALTLEMKAGVIPVEAHGDRWTLAAQARSWCEVQQSRAQLASILGLEEADIGERPLWIDTGSEQLVVPVVSDDAVRRARPRAESFFELRNDLGRSMAFVFHDRGEMARTVEARFFFPSGPAIVEDPATGSACANLGGWFRALHPGKDVERVVSQGEAVKRPSTLYLSVPAPSAMGEGGRIFVGGNVIELGRGSVTL